MQTMRPAALGLRAVKGGAVVVGVAIDDGAPRLLVSTMLATAAEGDPLSLAPYAVAAEIARTAPDEVEATVREGRRRQAVAAAQGLDTIVGTLAQAGFGTVVAALLVHRATWITDVLAYSLAWPEHVPVAEGLAVRDALRLALAARGIPIVETDETSLPDAAAQALGLTAVEIAARLKMLGAEAGRPWRREQKMACLTAWTALAGWSPPPRS